MRDWCVYAYGRRDGLMLSFLPGPTRHPVEVEWLSFHQALCWWQKECADTRSDAGKCTCGNTESRTIDKGRPLGLLRRVFCKVLAECDGFTCGQGSPSPCER